MKSRTSTIVFLFVLLVIFGVFILASASYFISCQKFGDCYYFLKHQLFYSLPFALVGFLFFYFLDYKILKKISLFVFIGSLILLGLVFIPGLNQTKGQARSWVNIFGINFQPAELAKIGFVVYLSAFFANKKEKVKDISEGLIPVAIIIGITSLFFVFQSDLGMLAMFVAVGLSLYFLSKTKISHVIILGLIFSSLGLLLAFNVSYVEERIGAYLNPGENVKTEAFQINQAIVAISSGGIFGKGLGFSSQKFDVLPEVISDSIFAVLGEELGFLGTGLAIVFYTYFIFKLFVLASDTPDKFSKFLVSGLTLFIVFQIFLNIGGNLGITPLTGVPLPFFGYGGSNLLFLFASFGIILNISKKRKEKRKPA